MNVIAPAFLSAVSANDIVGFNVASMSGSTPATITSFGQVFKDGQLTSSDGLSALVAGASEPVQVDAKTFYADGSVQFAVLTYQQPEVQAGQVLQGMLSTAPQTASASAVDIASLLASHSVDVTLHYQDGSQTVVDVAQALSNAITGGTAEFWLHGPLATQARVSIPVQGSLRLLATITAYADGTFSANIGFDNDIAMSGQGGAETYSADIAVDGASVFHQPQLQQAQYQDWNTTVWGGGGQSPTTVVQHDPAYLEKSNAIPNFDLSNGVDPSKISYFTGVLSGGAWDSALSNNDVNQLMPTTGGRPDIGITTEANAIWLITQDPTAQAFALGQANASGAVPWNFWNAQAGTWLNTSQYSNIWTDGRGGTSDTGSVGLTQQVSDQTGWETDTSHQPDLSYYAYLMTGNEQYLDSLNAQASFAITNTWEAYRGSQQLVVGYDQVRASAWNLREVDEAAWANPEGSAERAYFSQISGSNWSWLVSQIPEWTAKQGEAYGQVEGYSWGSANYSRPWMQDYFASVAAEAARHGNADAKTFLTWESNFLVGRFLNEANGFNPRDGIAYTLSLGPDNSDGNVRYQTWAQIDAATVAGGWGNGTGWSDSIGDYGMLALVSLADIISVTGSTNAIRAYNYLVTSGAPFTSAEDRANNNQFNIIPSLPSGYAFAANGQIEQTAPSASDGAPATQQPSASASGAASETPPVQTSNQTNPETTTTPTSSNLTTSSASIDTTTAQQSGGSASNSTSTSGASAGTPSVQTSGHTISSSNATSTSEAANQTASSASIDTTTAQQSGGLALNSTSTSGASASTPSVQISSQTISSSNATSTSEAANQIASSTSIDTSTAPQPDASATSPATSSVQVPTQTAPSQDVSVPATTSLPSDQMSLSAPIGAPTGQQPDASSLGAALAGSSTQAPSQNAPGHDGTFPAASVIPEQTAMFRFFDSANGTHFYTSDAVEAASLTNPSSPAYRADLVQEHSGFNTISAAAAQNDLNAIKINRLFSTTDGTHFFTGSADELKDLTAPGSSTYRADLVFEPSDGFYAHLQAEDNDVPIYRFFDTHYGTHFFTSDQSEASQMRTPSAAGFRPDMTFEGIAFYAPKEAT